MCILWSYRYRYASLKAVSRPWNMSKSAMFFVVFFVSTAYCVAWSSFFRELRILGIVTACIRVCGSVSCQCSRCPCYWRRILYLCTQAHCHAQHTCSWCNSQHQCNIVKKDDDAENKTQLSSSITAKLPCAYLRLCNHEICNFHFLEEHINVWDVRESKLCKWMCVRVEQTFEADIFELDCPRLAKQTFRVPLVKPPNCGWHGFARLGDNEKVPTKGDKQPRAKNTTPAFPSIMSKAFHAENFLWNLFIMQEPWRVVSPRNMVFPGCWESRTGLKSRGLSSLALCGRRSSL
jgi:hypothetical protein